MFVNLVQVITECELSNKSFDESLGFDNIWKDIGIKRKLRFS